MQDLRGQSECRIGRERTPRNRASINLKKIAQPLGTLRIWGAASAMPPTPLQIA